MRFSGAFGVRHGKKSPWFNPLLSQDTPLYVNPFLVSDDNSPCARVPSRKSGPSSTLQHASSGNPRATKTRSHTRRRSNC